MCVYMCLYFDVYCKGFDEMLAFSVQSFFLGWRIPNSITSGLKDCPGPLVCQFIYRVAGINCVGVPENAGMGRMLFGHSLNDSHPFYVI